MPRRPYEKSKITAEQVSAFITLGTPINKVAKLVGLSLATLYKYYREEIDLSKERADATIMNALFSAAKSGNVTAMIFWMKSHAGWAEKQRLEVDDLRDRSDDELIAAAASILGGANPKS